MKSLLLLLALIPGLALGKVKIFTTTTNLASLAKAIGGDHVEVESLCKGHQDPHFLEAKPSYTFKLSRADLLISVGAGLEVGWLPLIIRGSRNPKLRDGGTGSLVASEHVEMLEIPKTDELSRAEGDVHPEGNPHFMLSPSRALSIGKILSAKLSQLDDKHASFYKENFERFEKLMKNRLEEWKKTLPKSLKVISYHKTLTYFYDEFGITNVDVLEPKPGIPPTASHILALIKKIKEENIKYIVVENYFDDSVAKRIKKEIPSVKILKVPVAVEGISDIKNLYDLYNYLVKGLSS
jgi:zinc/manganese transport system substrate-binding protein